MTPDEFWSLIDKSRAIGQGDDNSQREALVQALRALEDSEIIEFSKQYHSHMVRSYRWDISNAVLLIEGYLGDDGFWDFMDFLVSRGKEVYERVLQDPESLLDHPLDYDELYFSAAASEAYRLKRGLDIHDDLEIPGDYKWPEDLFGERIDDDDEEAIRERYPRIWKHLNSAGG